MLNQTSRKAPEALILQAHQAISELLINVTGMDYVLLCSPDGFELSAVHKKNIYNTSKLAAVSSSIMAMVNAFIHEIDLQGCEGMTLDAANGKAIFTMLPNKNHPMIIIALTSKDILLGQAHYYLKKCAEKIQQADLNYPAR